MALAGAAETHAIQRGHSAIYLKAADSLTGFYEALGWRIVERAYGWKQLNIMKRCCTLHRASGWPASVLKAEVLATGQADGGILAHRANLRSEQVGARGARGWPLAVPRLRTVTS